LVFNEGDFVKVEYNAWRVADNKLVYTTSKKVAEDNQVFDEEATYAPQLVVLGKDTIIKGVEAAIKTMSVNETKKVELQPKDAFGEKAAELVKVLPLADFKKRDIAPYPGMQLDIDGGVATIKSVNSGRVVVDANHPLAGEKLLYEIKVVEKVEKDEDRIKAIAAMCSLVPDSVTVTGANIKVAFGEKIKKDRKYLIGKSDFLNTSMRLMEKVARITVEEDYARPSKTEAKEAEEEHEHVHEHTHEHNH
jgi:FKBP-type peptidyl-prolyl cis-trans isomerase 2